MTTRNTPKALVETPKLIYVDLPNGLGGRGGVVRFFLLANNIPFTEELIPMSDWPEHKATFIKEGVNPAGTVPIVQLGDKTLTQHVAIMRYLANLAGVSTGDPYRDYIQDLVADEYQGWRDAWVSGAFGDDEAKNNYAKETVAKKLRLFEGLYAKYKMNDAFLSTSPNGVPLWGDAAIYGLIRDNIISSFLDENTLEEHPCLNKLFKKYGALPKVASWVQKAAT
uniref:Glutathione S-transferase n=1 Tax=Aplanochytrium stocchinoi TaxID=215587 RepID=A0A7S3PFA0_9STRA|mmetsp:Transcript_7821/g.9923  ORF Transcript_7821/g.9923 Transcript_7821/m.9923 type:complete len:224 (-) Transcript_7821:146-817(-)|eukprot:CAMPEP_0204829664 /NCGR_PEP_ID=MMETSP1346-20131115/7946_1 /ASSEMBLY_ACC=CAM_ASM_000771 /TAXON_ID=215587 /ORGANISM="Aplanochytrium stocchinoi, Strain GSBS06" /LENGTH=223 /DNA_ID=CAMNT_0051959647 /DNA_START=227 /DNA_END=898 /DNA_ORIENTATION=-